MLPKDIAEKELTKFKRKNKIKDLNLTKKEIERSDGNWTVVVRRQSNNKYMVATVLIKENKGIVQFLRYVENKSDVGDAIKELLRDMDKLGLTDKMAGASRDRWIECLNKL